MAYPEVTQAAARIARVAPEQWKMFMAAVAQYTNHQRENCVNSPLAVLPVMQGRAQNATELHKLLEACLSEAEKIERNKK